MPIVQIPIFLKPYQVDDFDKDIERSTKGALHFLPNSTKVITDSELEHIQKKHTNFYNKIVVIPFDTKQSRCFQKETKSAEKKEPKVIEKKEEKSTSKYKKKSTSNEEKKEENK